MAVICAVLMLPADVVVLANSPQQAAAPAAPADQASAKLPPDQLDSLVAPIALYPDPLLAQTLAASTYPLEIIQLQQWLEKNKNLKDKALVDAVSKQPWDPSVQAMAALPDVVKRLASDIQWTTDLGNAFLAQQSDVMDAVQRMRKKAQDSGNLKSNEQQKIETKVVESKQVIVVQQASPEVVYVPSYNPTVVYGAPAYPYPPIYYPPPGYYAAGMAISFGVGVAMGAAWGGGWGWGCGWGGNNDITINNNNNFNRNSNISGGNRTNVGSGNRPANQPARGGANAGGKWQHNPQHRGGAPYANRDLANKYGGTARGDSLANRQANARQNQGQRGSFQQAGTGDRGAAGGRQQAGVSDRTAGGRQQGGVSDRSAGNRQQASLNDRSAGGRDVSNRSSGAGVSDMSRGGGDRVGNRSVSDGGGSRGNSAFGGGGSGGFSGSSARASSSRGASSMGGGGGRRGGGGGRRR
ncbi:MAG TPA: DUF3300 domain-containing protein [Terriglobales bacterium]|nr:DUF3300 domain-containing protein [Terriglobales bacterium]